MKAHLQPLNRVHCSDQMFLLWQSDEKAEEQEINLQTSTVSEKAREFQKNIYFYLIDKLKPLCRSQQTCGKFFKRWEYQTTLPAS